MSKLLDRFRYFKQKGETFADGHGQVMHSNRDWEDSYRQRWQFDKIVRSTHGVNCTGSCSWKIYVKNGLVTWEIQQTDYPRTRPDLPNHEPRGCPRGASYSWYLYSANRLKYPLIRKRLIELWREALKQHSDPVLAWESIMNDPQKCLSYKQVRGRGGFIRSNWQELNQLIAAANVWTIKTYGPDRVAGFSPIPAMSMVSYAAGTRYLSLLGGTCLSFYDWYCDLPPASPMTWGEQTDVPESADWYNSSYIIAWGSNVPQTRTPDAHFFTEVRYKGTKTIAITPDYSEVAKLCDQWLAPKQGTDSALAMAMGHVILKEFHLNNPSDYFLNYCRRYSDMPMLVMLEAREDGSYVPGRMMRASDLIDSLGESNNPQWKTVAVNTAGELVAPNGSIGFRWGEKGKWNLESVAAGAETELSLTLLNQHDTVVGVAFPYFGGIENPHFRSVKHNPILVRQLPVKNLTLADGRICPVVSVYDLVLANYGLDRGLEDENSAKDYAEIKAYTPAWGEQITGVPRQYIETIAREFADTAHKTHGRSMIILGAGVNHWYHMDMNYRGMINMLIFCGCVGQSGGGWAHYVGQEKLRPQTGWLPLAFALDWNRPPRQMNSTSFFYNHSSQWRYEKVTARELLSPLADASQYSGHLIDFNVRAERMGWLPSSPQLGRNPLTLKAEADKAGLSPTEFTAQALKSGELRMACEQPDSGSNHPRNLFVWRSNLLGSSGKGHEYMQKYLLGTESGIQGKELGASDEIKLHELIPWRTLSGRQQLYQDHPWMRAFGESLVAYRPPIDTRSVSEMRQIPPNGFPEKALNFLTPHQKWGIHSTYSENQLMLTLSRGGPIVWISETDARELSIVDNDWVEVFNANGALTARAVVSQRVPPGMTMMYHAQERIMNIPGSEVTGMRGGIHNSVTRVCPKPTHMIGGYAQLAWGFNYYGTVGSNRDEFIMIRKMKNINWLDDEGRDQVQEAKK
ncbi:nitrate reductase subunit alpha [Escherichia albertii]|uniref:nitrate reductase subunit alpha n=1 Tax=Escherichia albertii TaxID=208962 RepID=UPI000E5AFD2B|nr:nitrate reductase subunit alpha [Escherichia albertii]